MEEKKAHSHIYHFKCQGCQLEFAVYSWDANWDDHFVSFCPECGKQTASFLGKATSDKPIFELKYELGKAKLD